MFDGCTLEFSLYDHAKIYVNNLIGIHWEQRTATIVETKSKITTAKKSLRGKVKPEGKNANTRTLD